MEREQTIRLSASGVPVSPGYAIGPIGLLNHEPKAIVERSISQERVPHELQLFEKAQSRTVRELRVLRGQLSKHLSEHDARIFETHAQIVQGPEISEGIPRMIRNELVSAETATFRVTQRIEQIFAQSEASFKDKALDIADVAQRLLSHLDEEGQAVDRLQLSEPSILMAHTLTPSLLTSADADKILGFATDTGGSTSHVAILARSLQIPAISGLKDASFSAKKGELAILDGINGVLIINPSSEELALYQNRREGWLQRQKELKESTATTRSLTADGKYIPLLSNIELPKECAKAVEVGSEGVGLFRSEFIFFSQSMPSEEEQFKNYREVLEQLHPHPVTIRTLDAGGDKVLKNIQLNDDANPEMGWRSIRFCLDNHELFREQLRALLRASFFGKLRLMFPMISSLEELLEAKRLYSEERQKLESEGVRIADDIELGTMIEVPSAVLQMKDLAREVDFVSIGTNDLIQFTLAVDRSNEKIKELYRPHHPAVLRMVQMVCDAAHQADIPVYCCGEMASDAISMILLIGLGVDALSMSPSRIVANKHFLRSLHCDEMRSAAQSCLEMKTTDEIDRFLYSTFAKRVSDAGADSSLLSEWRFQDRAMVRQGDRFVGVSYLGN